MHSVRALVVGGVLLILIAGAIVCARAEPHDDEVYNQIATIKGNVQILNHPELGRTAASNEFLVFQRDGCKLCLVATRTDLDGNYQIFVGHGRYRIIVRNPSPPTYDMLAPGQPRYVEATSPLQDTHFDIKLRLPPAKH
jgi:hypothetical protein